MLGQIKTDNHHNRIVALDYIITHYHINILQFRNILIFAKKTPFFLQKKIRPLHRLIDDGRSSSKTLVKFHKNQKEDSNGKFKRNLFTEKRIKQRSTPTSTRQLNNLGTIRYQALKVRGEWTFHTSEIRITIIATRNLSWTSWTFDFNGTID